MWIMILITCITTDSSEVQACASEKSELEVFVLAALMD